MKTLTLIAVLLLTANVAGAENNCCKEGPLTESCVVCNISAEQMDVIKNRLDGKEQPSPCKELTFKGTLKCDGVTMDLKEQPSPNKEEIKFDLETTENVVNLSKIESTTGVNKIIIGNAVVNREGDNWVCGKEQPSPTAGAEQPVRKGWKIYESLGYSGYENTKEYKCIFNERGKEAL